jgi:hypothetical protein
VSWERPVDLIGYHLPSFAGAAATFAAVYGAFAKFDSDQSDDNRHFVRDWLLGLKVDDQQWKVFFVDLFAKLFGEEHLSLKCAWRSCSLSVALIFGIYLLQDIKNWQEFFKFSLFAHPYFTAITILIASVLSGCLVDYLSLWKTRLLLTRVKVLRNGFITAMIVVGDFAATTLIFVAINVIAIFLWVMWYTSGLGSGFHYPNVHIEQVMLGTWNIISNEFLYPGTVFPLWLLYLAALLTSAWLWAYVVVAYGMRGLNLLPRWLKPLSKVMDFENHPVRSIGYIAAMFSAVITGIFAAL